MEEKWDIRFLNLAKHISTWSKDPSTKVGAVIVNDVRQVVGLGYNGFPRGVEDTEERYTDRSLKYPMTAHAELNAVLNATAHMKGCTIYTWPLFTCNDCAKVIIQAGIKRVVSVQNPNKRWPSELAMIMYDEAEIAYCLYDVNKI